jgi:hypothetical protein
MNSCVSFASWKFGGKATHPFGRTLAHIIIDGRDLGEQLVREKLTLPHLPRAEASSAANYNSLVRQASVGRLALGLDAFKLGATRTHAVLRPA